MSVKKYPLLKAIIFFSLTAILISAGIFYRQFSLFVSVPCQPGAKEQIFSIPPGQSLNKIAFNLEQQKLISSHRFFIWYATWKKAANRLQAGEYLISASDTPHQILMDLVKGKVRLHKITLPEGLNIIETADRFEAMGFCPREIFSRLCHDPDFIQSLGIRSRSLEGYLFPDTYYFPKQSDCKTVISTLVKRFDQVFTTEWKNRASDLGFSVLEIVTLASIIEKETGNAFERPVIASVFHNRLKKNMRLESDPTVIYGIKNFDGNIKRKHLKEYTPYNTYQIKGLPLGPIANPGELSLKAALYPEQTEYLFFVSKQDTTHYFSKTIQEHNRAVRKYQLKKK